jgi:predicted small integral membrane protein
MIVNRKAITIVGLTVGTVFATFGFGTTVGAWLAGHGPDAWIVVLSLALSIVLATVLVVTCVKSPT